jgi:hypothetical protein
MSIDRHTFDNSSEDELEELSVPGQVLGFLAYHDDRAFEAREIASRSTSTRAQRAPRSLD